MAARERFRDRARIRGLAPHLAQRSPAAQHLRYVAPVRLTPLVRCAPRRECRTAMASVRSFFAVSATMLPNPVADSAWRPQLGPIGSFMRELVFAVVAERERVKRYPRCSSR